METVERIPLVEVAKLVRAALKQAFPRTRFSVTSNRYSGGSSIDVHWTDGPTDRQVRRVCDCYEGADFDGMQDLKTYHDTLLADTEGEVPRLVRLGVDFVMPSRRISSEWRAELEAEIAAFTELPANEWTPLPVTVQERLAGGGFLVCSTACSGDLGQLVHRLSCLRDRSVSCGHEGQVGYLSGNGERRCCGCGALLA